jgi:hypothetical protein
MRDESVIIDFVGVFFYQHGVWESGEDTDDESASSFDGGGGIQWDRILSLIFTQLQWVDEGTCMIGRRARCGWNRSRGACPHAAWRVLFLVGCEVYDSFVSNHCCSRLFGYVVFSER